MEGRITLFSAPPAIKGEATPRGTACHLLTPKALKDTHATATFGVQDKVWVSPAIPNQPQFADCVSQALQAKPISVF